MRYLKNNQRLLVCFSIQELIALLLLKDFRKIYGLAINNLYDLEKAKEPVFKLSKISANSKNYEIWVGIFDLYEEFNRDCEFCFYLKGDFDPHKDSINSLSDLEKFKEDPPDIAIYHKGQFAEFELKRFRDKLSEQDLFDFIDKKIIRHYSDLYNFLIVLQPKPWTNLSFEIFKALHKKIVEQKLERNLGKIVFSFNQNNREMVFVTVFPELNYRKRTFKKGSEQVKKILNEKR